MKIKSRITISRSSGMDGDAISIHIVDDASGAQFFDGALSLEQFTMLITGMGHVPIDAEVRGLEHVGKIRVREARVIVAPFVTYKTAEYETWLAENVKEEGWIVEPYLRSQGSVARNAGNTTALRYHVVKYVDPT